MNKENLDSKLANCNLVLMASLFAIATLLGTLGSLIASIGYGIYYKYWKPTLYIIPVALLMFVILLILLVGGVATEADAITIGAFLGIVPNLVSFLVFRDRIVTLRRRKDLN